MLVNSSPRSATPSRLASNSPSDSSTPASAPSIRDGSSLTRSASFARCTASSCRTTFPPEPAEYRQGVCCSDRQGGTAMRTRSGFDHEIQQLQDEILEMGSLVEKQIGRSI